MVLRLFNTLSRRVEDFIPLSPPRVSMYACGPTVYDAAHIGNFRTYLLADILLRTLTRAGYQVTYVQNITDVGHLMGDGDVGEDKVLEGARREGLSALEISQKYLALFVEDGAKLNIIPPAHWVKATEHINEQIAFIKALEEKGYVYHTSDGIYFDTFRFSHYGAPAGLDVGGLLEGARVPKNAEKKNATDFALWKFSQKTSVPVLPVGKRAMEWDSPWGVGFPGWHIECSAMSTHYLGEHFDIHMGGVDLLLHHTNELAQNEARFGHSTVNYWVHNEFVLVDGKKMSKSLGNTYTMSDIEKRELSPLAYRYLTMQTHYRQQMNFNWDALTAANNARERLSRIVRDAPSGGMAPEKSLAAFDQKICNDLDTPGALEVLWSVCRQDSLSPAEKRAFALSADEVLGLGITKSEEKEIPKEVRELARQREEARQDGDFSAADALRKKIRQLGYTVNDTLEGPKLLPL